MVTFKNSDYGEITVIGHSLTDSGVIVDFGQHAVPPIGTIMQTVIKRHTGILNKTPVPMKLMMEHPDGDYEFVFLN